MTTFSTGNPVPSTDSRDLSDNAENFDSSVNSRSDTWIDRIGVTRDTVSGRIKKMGFTAPVAYAASIVFGINDNVKTVEEGSVVYAPLPSALPFTTSGTFIGDDDARFFVVQGSTSDSTVSYEFETLTDAINSTEDLPIKKVVNIKDKGDGEGATFDVYASGTFPVSEYVIDSLTNPIQFVSRDKFGAENLRGYDVFDTNMLVPFQESADYAPSLTGVLHTGQSLAAGGVGADDIGTVYEPLNSSRAFMLSGQPVHQRDGTWSKKLTALSERNFGEDSIRVTIASSFLNWVIDQEIADSPGNKWVFTGQAWGAMDYADLKKGGSTGVYEKVIDQITDVFALQSSIKYEYLTVIHGETDGLNNNLNYEANLVEWQSDFNTDVKVVTGQTEDVLMLLCQVATAGGYDFNGGITDIDFTIPQSQLDAQDSNALITMVTSKYHLPYNDRSHITNLGQRTLGEYYGKALAKIRASVAFSCVRPLTISRPTTSSIQIDYDGVIGSLSFDTTLVTAITNQGFAYVDDSARTITSVTITGPAQITIQLSGAIGDNPFVAYAYHNGSGGDANQVAGLGDRGNLRDSDPALSRFDSNIKLYNWAVIFKKVVPA